MSPRVLAQTSAQMDKDVFIVIQQKVLGKVKGRISS